VRVAELGGGSGNIGISVLQERPRWEWHAFELNPDTLPYLEANRRELLPADASYQIHVGDFFQLAPALAPFDWIVANPPYVPAEDWGELSKEVRHEPRVALDGGPKGLDCLTRLVPAAASLLSTGGGFLCEIDSRQAIAMEGLLTKHGYEAVETIRDWAGLDRISYGKRK
jgi:release factor glutamine methyltransferase